MSVKTTVCDNSSSMTVVADVTDLVGLCRSLSTCESMPHDAIGSHATLTESGREMHVELAFIITPSHIYYMKNNIPYTFPKVGEEIEPFGKVATEQVNSMRVCVRVMYESRDVDAN